MIETALKVEGLNVHFGAAHILQGVDLTLGAGVTAVVGRNGMGKTTLCNAVMGLAPMSSGRIEIFGQDVTGFAPDQIVRLGVGYVPQGRRVWPSLSVDEHLHLTAGGRRGAFSVERVYQIFPRLAERKKNRGGQLSGGEQQMLAIGRALLTQPRLLIMDEPTEGLAPVIVEHMVATLKGLGAGISILLIEQNIRVACDISDQVDVMVSGRIARSLPSAELIQNPELQRRLIGVSEGDGDLPDQTQEPASADSAGQDSEVSARPGRSHPTRWSRRIEQKLPVRTAASRTRWDSPAAEPDWSAGDESFTEEAPVQVSPGLGLPVASVMDRAAFIAGTYDTKGRELLFIKSLLDKQGLRTVTVDVSTSQAPMLVSISAREVASHHPGGAAAVFTGDRGSAVSAMAEAFARFITSRPDVGGLVSCGGSGGTALVTSGMRQLAIGIPKVMVSTVASGQVGHYVGPSDITMMYSVTDVQGINRISEKILANAAHGLAGMIAFAHHRSNLEKDAIGMTMFGVTTACVTRIQSALSQEYDCLVFHATGVGGRSMEKLIDSNIITAALDITTTEVADMIVGGVLPADQDRLGAIIRTGIPYVGSVGALDMVNFHGRDTVPDQFGDRNLYVHNPQVTLMRTTPDENRKIGRWIASRLNDMTGPVRFLFPMQGVSAIDARGQPFHDPEADHALFETIEAVFSPSADRKLIAVDAHINDEKFADALVGAFREITQRS